VRTTTILGIVAIGGICLAAVCLTAVLHEGAPGLVLVASGSLLASFLSFHYLWGHTMKAINEEKRSRRNHPDVVD
jgi:hypothetical protein